MNWVEKSLHVGLREKTDTYLIDDGGEDKKAKDTKKCVMKKT